MYELSPHYHHSYKRFTTKDGSTMKWENDGMTFDKQECLDNDQKIHDDFNLELLPRLKMISIAMEPFPAWRPHCLDEAMEVFHASTPADPFVGFIVFHCSTQTPLIDATLAPIYITPPGTFTQIHQDGCGTGLATTAR
jgi:hypothetical protein